MAGPVNFPGKGMGAKNSKYKASMKRPPKSTMKGKINQSPRADIRSKI